MAETETMPKYLNQREIADTSITRSQFYDMSRKDWSMTPERRLQLALLVSGIEDTITGAKRKGAYARRWREDAEIWFKTTEGPFSFIGVCENLNINHEYLLKGLAAWDTKLLARRMHTSRSRPIKVVKERPRRRLTQVEKQNRANKQVSITSMALIKKSVKKKPKARVSVVV